MKTIDLTQGRVALIDDEDYWKIFAFTWCAKETPSGHWYAYTTMNGKQIAMHTYILDTENQIDHKDNNGLNKQKSNIRICNQSQNMANRAKFSGNYSSRYKGVFYEDSKGKWRAHIQINYEKIKLGTFENEEEAARAYDKAALEAWGDFAKLNFSE